jgi:hypothetical protein
MVAIQFLIQTPVQVAVMVVLDRSEVLTQVVLVAVAKETLAVLLETHLQHHQAKVIMAVMAFFLLLALELLAVAVELVPLVQAHLVTVLVALVVLVLLPQLLVRL